MRWWRGFRKRVRSLFHSRRVEDDMRREIESHIEDQAAWYQRQGMAADEARRRALVDFGGAARVEEECREARGFTLWHDLGRDARHALRGVRRTPAFATAVIATVALGVGVNTVMFSLVRGILLRPLPFREPDRLVVAPEGTFARGVYVALRERTRTLEDLAAFTSAGEVNLAGADEPARIAVSFVSGNFFDVLGVRPSLGRGFLPGENEPSRVLVAVLSHALWRERYGGDPGILGRSILVEDTRVQVVGVMPAGFRFPSEQTALWMPVAINRANPGALWGIDTLQLAGRMKPGVTEDQVRAELRVLMPRVRGMFPWRLPDVWGSNPQASGLHDRMVGSVRLRLLFLSGAVALVLLIACVNVANLLLVRGAARQRELAIRRALGASAGRLARQAITESVLLAGIGGLAGVALAAAALPALTRAAGQVVPRRAEVAVDAAVLLFSFAISLAAGLLFGLVPAWRAARERGRPVTGSRSRQRISGALVAGEVALATVLVASAGLALRSLWGLMSVDPGFRMEGLLTARITMSDPACRVPAPCVQFYDSLLARVESLPDVSGAALASGLPLDGSGFLAPYTVEGHVVPPGAPPPLVWQRTVTARYPAVMGIPLLDGRALSPSDRNAALINSAMARQFWPGGSALGRRIKPAWWSEWLTVVGVVGGVRHRALADEPGLEVYALYGRPEAPSGMSLVARIHGRPEPLAASLRAIVRELSGNVPVKNVWSYRQLAAVSVAQPRLFAWSLGAFAMLALALGAVGIYGVIAYAVAQRRQEIGLRLALGAQPADITWLVLRQGIAMCGIGTLAGLVLMLGTGGLLRRHLYQVSPADLPTYAAVAAVLLLVGMLASWAPARRATRVDPVVTLKTDA